MFRHKNPDTHVSKPKGTEVETTEARNVFSTNAEVSKVHTSVHVLIPWRYSNKKGFSLGIFWYNLFWGNKITKIFTQKDLLHHLTLFKTLSNCKIFQRPQTNRLIQLYLCINEKIRHIQKSFFSFPKYKVKLQWGCE